MICNMSAVYGAGHFIRFISMNPREIAKAVERSPGSRASGLQRVRAEALAKELGSLGHGPLRLVCATFSGKSKRL